MNATLISIPTTSPTASQTTIPTASQIRTEIRTPADVALPRRFDVHVTADTTAAVADLIPADGVLSIDASKVEMIDLAGLAALTAVAEAMPVRFVRPSVAFLATVRYTGHDLLADCCELPAVRHTFAAAA